MYTLLEALEIFIKVAFALSGVGVGLSVIIVFLRLAGVQ